LSSGKGLVTSIIKITNKRFLDVASAGEKYVTFAQAIGYFQASLLVVFVIGLIFGLSSYESSQTELLVLTKVFAASFFLIKFVNDRLAAAKTGFLWPVFSGFMYFAVLMVKGILLLFELSPWYIQFKINTCLTPEIGKTWEHMALQLPDLTLAVMVLANLKWSYI
jgi:hypothetical protein